MTVCLFLTSTVYGINLSDTCGLRAPLFGSEGRVGDIYEEFRRRELRDLVKDYNNFTQNRDKIRKLTLQILGINDISEFKPAPTKGITTAAGTSSRMGGSNKALLAVEGQPIIESVLDILKLFDEQPMVVVQQHGWRDALGIFHEKGTYREVMDVLEKDGYSVEYSFQDYIKGDGIAILSALDRLKGFDGNVLVIWGDKAVLRKETVLWLVAIHQALGDISFSIASVLHESPYAVLFTDEQGYVAASRKGVEIEFGLDDIGVFIGKYDRVYEALGSMLKDVRTVNDLLQERLQEGIIEEINEGVIRDFYVKDLKVDDFEKIRENPDWDPLQVEVYCNPYDGSVNKRGELNFAQIVSVLKSKGLLSITVPLADEIEYKGVDTFEDLEKVLRLRQELKRRETLDSVKLEREGLTPNGNNFSTKEKKEFSKVIKIFKKIKPLRDLIRKYWKEELKTLYLEMRQKSGILLQHGINAGAGSDISTFLFVSNATKGDFYDEFSYGPEIDEKVLFNAENIEKYARLKEDWGVMWSDDYETEKYMGWVRDKDYAERFGKDYLPAIIWELWALGVQEIEINKVDNFLELTFGWKHPEDSEAKKRSIILRGRTDIFKGLKKYYCETGKKTDFYMQKALSFKDDWNKTLSRILWHIVREGGLAVCSAVTFYGQSYKLLSPEYRKCFKEFVTKGKFGYGVAAIYKKESSILDISELEQIFNNRGELPAIRAKALKVWCKLLLKEKDLKELLFDVLDDYDEAGEVLEQAIRELRVFVRERFYDAEVVEKYVDVYRNLESYENSNKKERLKLRNVIIKSLAFVQVPHKEVVNFLKDLIDDKSTFTVYRNSADDVFERIQKNHVRWNINKVLESEGAINRKDIEAVVEFLKRLDEEFDIHRLLIHDQERGLIRIELDKEVDDGGERKLFKQPDIFTFGKRTGRTSRHVLIFDPVKWLKRRQSYIKGVVTRRLDKFL